MTTMTINNSIVPSETTDTVLAVASHLLTLYKRTFQQEMDEMKFHKLMYFAQRESFIQSGKPLFNATFYGWKYGPILKEIRSIYKTHCEGTLSDTEVSEYADEVLKTTLQHYGEIDSWELSLLSHGERSWINSRIGVPLNENSDRPINNEDIAEDAKRVIAFRASDGPILYV